MAATAFLALAAGCTSNGPRAGDELIVEFVLDRHGGLCYTPDGGGLCQLRVVVKDDGAWSATGTPTPLPSAGVVRAGSASELAAIVEDGWEALTAREFTATCPTAYDGSETAYTVRRIVRTGDADIRQLRSCAQDFGHAGAQAVLAQLEELLVALGLPH